MSESHMSKDEVQVSRVTRSKEQAKASYDRLSTWYDVLAGRSERKHREAGLRKLDAREGETILEIGFGTGHAILALARAVGSSGKVYGVDISEGMLDRALSRVKEAGLLGRVKLERGDGAQLPFEADSFDAVFLSFTLELFDTPEIPVVLRECQRVLHRGGRICVVAMSKEHRPGVMVRLYGWAHRALPTYVDCRPILVQKALEDTGFQLLDVTETSMWGLPVRIVLAGRP